ncbi:hypothetical protein [uncultured Marivita sp.]|uniref:hypothetical protein n=1 Tax=uncultured Marivita sp. TaxID=888080 RepID=UPI0026086BBA|nr:hypothetical protein [uncultured Marivita sp.]
MPEIGIKIYKLNLYENHNLVPFGHRELGGEPERHIRWLFGRALLFNDPARQRTYRAEMLEDGDDYFHGYIQYGMYGIASTINVGMVAPREDDDAPLEPREMEVIRRGALDVEEIPIYFMAYFPPGEVNAYIAFQTYQTRSCAMLVLGHVIQTFNQPREHLNQRLTVQKVMLSGEHDPAIRNAPVKEITLIRNRMNADRFNRYIRAGIEEIKLRMTIAAVRGRSLGQYIGIFDQYRAREGDILLFDGIEFEKAVALVDVGGKRRKVNLIGYNSTAGSIDISDQVDFDDNEEYPTQGSMEPIFRDSIGDLAERLAEQGRQ